MGPVLWALRAASGTWALTCARAGSPQSCEPGRDGCDFVVTGSLEIENSLQVGLSRRRERWGGGL